MSDREQSSPAATVTDDVAGKAELLANAPAVTSRDTPVLDVAVAPTPSIPAPSLGDQAPHNERKCASDEGEDTPNLVDPAVGLPSSTEDFARLEITAAGSSTKLPHPSAAGGASEEAERSDVAGNTSGRKDGTESEISGENISNTPPPHGLAMMESQASARDAASAPRSGAHDTSAEDGDAIGGVGGSVAGRTSSAFMAADSAPKQPLAGIAVAASAQKAGDEGAGSGSGGEDGKEDVRTGVRNTPSTDTMGGAAAQPPAGVTETAVVGKAVESVGGGKDKIGAEVAGEKATSMPPPIDGPPEQPHARGAVAGSTNEAGSADDGASPEGNDGKGLPQSGPRFRSAPLPILTAKKASAQKGGPVGPTQGDESKSEGRLLSGAAAGEDAAAGISLLDTSAGQGPAAVANTEITIPIDGPDEIANLPVVEIHKLMADVSEDEEEPLRNRNQPGPVRGSTPIPDRTSVLSSRGRSRAKSRHGLPDPRDSGSVVRPRTRRTSRGDPERRSARGEVGGSGSDIGGAGQLLTGDDASADELEAMKVGGDVAAEVDEVIFNETGAAGGSEAPSAFYTTEEVAASVRALRTPLGWEGPDLGRDYDSKTHQKNQNRRGVFWRVVVEEINITRCTNSASIDKWQFSAIDDRPLVRGGTGQRPVVNTGLKNLDLFTLCSNITMLKMEHCTDTTRKMVSYAAREDKYFVDNADFAVCVSGARNLEALRTKMSLGDFFSCKFLVPEPQGLRNMENEVGSNVYGFSPQEVQNAALILQSGDSDSRRVTLVEHLAQLQYAYGSAVLTAKTPAHRLNEGRQSKHRLVKEGLADEDLVGKIVPWFPRFGVDMVGVDKALYQRCLQQLFAQRDSVVGSEAVRRAALGDEVLTRELHDVLTVSERGTVLAEEKRILRQANCGVAVTTLKSVRDFLNNSIGCSNFQGLLVSILDVHPNFFTFATLISKRTFYRLKGDYAKSLALMLIYKGYVGLTASAEGQSLEDKQASFLTYSSISGIIDRVVDYLHRLQNCWVVACDAADGDSDAVAAINKIGGALPMTGRDAEGVEKKFLVPMAFVYALGDQFTQDLLNVSKQTPLLEMTPREHNNELEPLVAQSKSFAQTFLCYALNETIETDKGFENVELGDLVGIEVPKTLAEDIVTKRSIASGERGKRVRKRGSSSVTKKPPAPVPTDPAQYRAETQRLKKQKKAEELARALEATTASRIPGPSDLHRARLVRRGVQIGDLVPALDSGPVVPAPGVLSSEDLAGQVSVTSAGSAAQRVTSLPSPSAEGSAVPVDGVIEAGLTASNLPVPDTVKPSGPPPVVTVLPGVSNRDAVTPLAGPGPEKALALPVPDGSIPVVIGSGSGLAPTVSDALPDGKGAASSSPRLTPDYVWASLVGSLPADSVLVPANDPVPEGQEALYKVLANLSLQTEVTSASYPPYNSDLRKGSYALWKRAVDADQKLEADLLPAYFFELEAFVRTHGLFSSILDGRGTTPESVTAMVKSLRLVKLFDLWADDQGKRYAEEMSFDGIYLTRSLLARKMKQSVASGATSVANLQLCWGSGGGDVHPFFSDALHGALGLFYGPALSACIAVRSMTEEKMWSAYVGGSTKAHRDLGPALGLDCSSDWFDKKFPTVDIRRRHHRMFTMCLRGSQVGRIGGQGTFSSLNGRLSTASAWNYDDVHGSFYSVDSVTVAGERLFELIISVAAEVYVDLFGASGGDIGVEVSIPHKLGCEASYHWLVPDMDNTFSVGEDAGKDQMGSGYFQKVTVYSDRVVGNMRHFVTTRRYGLAKGDINAADPDLVPPTGVCRVGEELFGGSVDVTILVRDDSNCGGWNTAGIRPFDYSGTGGFAFLSVFLAMTRPEDLEILGSQVFFPHLMQALSREAGYYEVVDDLLDIGDRSGFGFLSMNVLCPSVVRQVLAVGGMASNEKDDNVGSGFSMSMPLLTSPAGTGIGCGSYYEGSTTSSDDRLDLVGGSVIVQPLRWGIDCGSFVCSSGNLGVDLCQRRQASLQTGNTFIGVSVPPDAWMPLLEFGEGEDHALHLDLVEVSGSRNVLPTDIRRRCISGPVNTNFEFFQGGGVLLARRSSVNWAVSSALVAPVLTWELRWK